MTVDREHMKSLVERYRGRAAHSKHTSKLQTHADHLKKLESSGDHSGYLLYLASKVLRNGKSAKAARAVAGIEEYVGHSGKLAKVQEFMKHTMLRQVEKAWEDDFHSWFAFRDMLGLKKGQDL
jgi:hypothetical protein